MAILVTWILWILFELFLYTCFLDVFQIFLKKKTTTDTMLVPRVESCFFNSEHTIWVRERSDIETPGFCEVQPTY